MLLAKITYKNSSIVWQRRPTASKCQGNEAY